MPRDKYTAATFEYLGASSRERDSEAAALWSEVDRLRSTFDDLENCDLGIAWRLRGEDPDSGRLPGKVIILPELLRQVCNGHDVLLVVNRPTWESLGPELRTGYVMSMLCRVRRKVDGEGEPKLRRCPDKDGGYTGLQEVYSEALPPRGEFARVLDKVGIWNAQLKTQGAVLARARQLVLSLREYGEATEAEATEAEAPLPS